MGINTGEERRAYDRVRLGLECIVYANEKECTCTIKDISERGAGITVCDLSVGDMVELSFVDSSDEFLNVYPMAHIVSKGTVVRKSDNDVGITLFRSMELLDYVNNRQAAMFINRIAQI